MATEAEKLFESASKADPDEVLSEDQLHELKLRTEHASRETAAALRTGDPTAVLTSVVESSQVGVQYLSATARQSCSEAITLIANGDYEQAQVALTRAQEALDGLVLTVTPDEGDTTPEDEEDEEDEDPSERTREPEHPDAGPTSQPGPAGQPSGPSKPSA